MDWEAEASDREGLGLPGRTDELVEKILAVRPDAIIVNQSGSSVAFPWVEKATTLCQSWFGGNETGVLFTNRVKGTSEETDDHFQETVLQM